MCVCVCVCVIQFVQSFILLIECILFATRIRGGLLTRRKWGKYR